MLLRDLLPKERQEIGENIGIKVVAVVEGSPAFYANVMRGDVVERVGDIGIRTQSDWHRALSKYKGKTTTVIIWRDGKIIAAHITMGG